MDEERAVVVIKGSEKLPDPDLLKRELDFLFGELKHYHKNDVSAEDSALRLEKIKPYVIAIDPDFRGSLSEGVVPQAEMVELRCISKLFDAQISLLKKNKCWADAFRLKLLHYLQIIEADYPITLVLNALLFHQEKKPEWKFLELGGENKEKNGLRHPLGKFEKLSSLAKCSHLCLSNQLSHLYKSELRNAIAHSHFHIHSDGGMLLLSGEHSPISRKISCEKLRGTVGVSYTREAFDVIYESAVRYQRCAEAHYRWFENLGKVR